MRSSTQKFYFCTGFLFAKGGFGYPFSGTSLDSFNLINFTLARGITFLGFDFDFLGNSLEVLFRRFLKPAGIFGIFDIVTLLKVLKGKPDCELLLCMDVHFLLA